MTSTPAERVVAHVRAHFGEPAWTIPFTKQEPHVRLFVFERPRGIPATLVVTCGMSELPMTVPAHVEDRSPRHAELCMLLPPSWPSEPSKMNDATAWPFDTLVDCARLPTRNKTWLWRAHTVYEGDPWPGSSLSSVLVTPPFQLDQKAWVIEGDVPIHLFQLVPITSAELALKKERGSPALEEELYDFDVQVFGALEPKRRCAVTGTSPFVDAPLATPAEPPLPEGGWLVVPARRAKTHEALDRLLAIAARAHDTTQLRIRQATCRDGTHLLLVFGMDLVALAKTLSLGEHRTAALRLHGERGAARLYDNGTETRSIRASRSELLDLVGEHVGSTSSDLRSAAGTGAETRVVYWKREGTPDPAMPNIPWNRIVDRDLEVELVAQRLSLDAAAIIDRFGVWRRALDHFEEAEHQHESMDDSSTQHALATATIAARKANADMLVLLRKLETSRDDIIFAALERVLDAGGVPLAYLAPFRAWCGA